MRRDRPTRGGRRFADLALLLVAAPLAAVVANRLADGFVRPDARLVDGLFASFGLGIAVAALALPLGLAAALAARRSGPRLGAAAVTALAAAALVPGATAGFATLLFWRDLGIPGGLGVAALARAGAAAPLAALLFLHRLRDLPDDLEATARDLGAPRRMILTQVLLPHLAPTAGLAGLLAFLLAFADHDTTVFAIGGGPTLSTEIASRLELGTAAGAETLGLALVAAVAAVLTVVAVLRRGRRGEKPPLTTADAERRRAG